MTGAILKRYKRLLSLIAVPLLILALTLSPAVGADDDGDGDIKVEVVGDEQLLDDVWDKVESSITDMPEDAVMTGKYVIGPTEGNGWTSERIETYCSYYFSHIVDGKKVPGDRFVVVINADTLERTPVWFYTPLNEVGSIEALEASKRPMIWDGSRAWEGDINPLPPYEVPAGYSHEAPGYENRGHGVNAAGMNDIPVADDCMVMGDEELLDSVWEKACTDIELPDGAILTIKAVIAPEESNVGGVPAVIWVNTPSEEFGKTHCSYCFGHLVDGELVDGDRYVIAINADTLERLPIVQRTPYYITGSIEASDASARSMIWDGSCPGIRTTPYYEVPAAYSMDGPADEQGNEDLTWLAHRDQAWAYFDTYLPYDGAWHSYRGFNNVSEDEDFICAAETSMHYAIAHSVGSGANMGYWAQSPHHYVYPSDVEDWAGDRHPMELAWLMHCNIMDNYGSGTLEAAFRKDETDNTITIGACYTPTDPADPYWAEIYHFEADVLYYYRIGETFHEACDIALDNYPNVSGHIRAVGDLNQVLQYQKDNAFISCGLADELEHINMAYLYESGVWYYYNPDWPYNQNTLHQLEMGKAYWISVDCSCTLEYGDNNYNLYTGWNNVGWVGYD